MGIRDRHQPVPPALHMYTLGVRLSWKRFSGNVTGMTMRNSVEQMLLQVSMGLADSSCCYKIRLHPTTSAEMNSASIVTATVAVIDVYCHTLHTHAANITPSRTPNPHLFLIHLNYFQFSRSIPASIPVRPFFQCPLSSIHSRLQKPRRYLPA